MQFENLGRSGAEEDVAASRILVVEDEPDMARLLMARLQEVAATFDVAEDATTAFRRATTESYDLIGGGNRLGGI